MLAGCDAKTINPLTRAICRIPDTNSERGIVHLIRGTLRNLPVPMADSSSLLPPQSFRVSGLQSWLSLYFSLGGNHKREKGKKKKKKRSDDDHHDAHDAVRVSRGRPPRRPAGRPRTHWYPEKTFRETPM